MMVKFASTITCAAPFNDIWEDVKVAVLVKVCRTLASHCTKPYQLT